MPQLTLVSPRICALLGAFAALFLSTTGFAATVQIAPGDDLLSAANALSPGDELVLGDGTYEMSARFLLSLRGSAQAPIVIRAADGAAPLIHRPNASQNIWDIDAEHLILRGLRFSGGSAGLRFLHAQHVTLEACEIFDTADVALRMNDTSQNYAQNTIIDNHIHHTSGTGEGMYLGCNQNGCQLSETLIARNYIHHTNGPGVSQGDGIEIKEGSWGNTIRDNVIHDTAYPCILTYSTAGNGPANIIDRNAMWACGDHGIQTSQDASITNNIILSAANSGIALQPHQAGAPTNLVIAHNTVFSSSDALALRGAAGDVLIANNAAYSGGASALLLKGDLSAVVVRANVGVGAINGPDGGLSAGDTDADFVDAHAGAGVMNVFPAAGGALIAAGDTAHVLDFDFNGTPRQGVADIGAYRFDAAGNPGWTIAPEFKDTPAAEPEIPDDSDAGATDVGLADTRSDDTASTPDAMPDASPSDVQNAADGHTQTPGEKPSSEGCGCNTPAQPTPFQGILFLAAIGLYAHHRWRATR